MERARNLCTHCGKRDRSKIPVPEGRLPSRGCDLCGAVIDWPMARTDNPCPACKIPRVICSECAMRTVPHDVLAREAPAFNTFARAFGCWCPPCCEARRGK